jgi:hypothetical protein
MTMIKTKAGRYTLAMLLIATGVLMDTSGAFVCQTFHHLAFILAGVAVGIGYKTKQ